MASTSDSRLLRYGTRAWAVLGVLGVLVAVLFTAQQVRVVVVAFVLALFPAALLSPAAESLRHTRIPNALFAILLVLLLLLAFVLPVWVVVPLFAQQVPDLADAVVRGLERLEAAVDWSALPGSPQGPGDLVERAAEAASSGDVLDQGLAAAATVVHTFTGLLLMIVVLFFCLKDGRRLWQGVLDLLPKDHQEQVDRLAGQAWWTLGAYLRGQLLVALFDAVFIGLGLWLLDVPLALPLAVLVFFGGLFPIVGAFASGLVAVLVAFADQGLVTAVLTLALIIVVQQVEGNVLEPLILSNIVALHPLVIVLSITAGALLLGILGAFVAVPLAAIIARVVDDLRGRVPAAGPSSR
jgi:predicted PurR-regulated permease PerM